MTNLYNFLSRILTLAKPPNCDLVPGPVTVNFHPDDILWLEQYLADPGVEIHFKARKVGELLGEPVYAQDYAIAGTGPDVFQLLCEAMLENANFADLVTVAAKFFKEHVPECHECMAGIKAVNQFVTNWEFKKHP